MKSLFTNIIIAIVCFTLGYMFYPTINETKVEPMLTGKTSANEHVKDDSATVKVEAPVSALTNEKSVKNSPEPLAIVVENIVIDKETTSSHVNHVKRKMILMRLLYLYKKN